MCRLQHASCNLQPSAAVQALHALSTVRPALCRPAKDPARFMRCLAPYLEGDTPTAQRSEDTERHSAAQLMCTLAVLKSCLACCGKLEEPLARQLTQDLAHLIAAHRFVQASSAPCLKEGHHTMCPGTRSFCSGGSLLCLDCLRQTLSSDRGRLLFCWRLQLRWLGRLAEVHGVIQAK